MSYENTGKYADSLTPFVITPTDDAPLLTNGIATATRAISFGSAGTLAVVTDKNEIVIIPSNALALGSIHFLKVKEVRATGTTATDIMGYV